MRNVWLYGKIFANCFENTEECGDVFRAARHGVEVFIRFWRPYFGFSPQGVVTSQTYILDKSYLMQFTVFSCYVRCRNAVVTVLVRCDVVAVVVVMMMVMAVMQ
jgi:hypothetical protein